MNNIIYYRLIPSCHPPAILAAGAGDPTLMPSNSPPNTPLTSLASIATSPLPLPPEPTPSATARFRILCLICCRRLSCSTGTGLALWGTTLKVTLSPNGPFFYIYLVVVYWSSICVRNVNFLAESESFCKHIPENILFVVYWSSVLYLDFV